MQFSASQLNNIKDLQASYNWMISFSGPTAAPISSDEVFLRCTSATLPKRTHESHEVSIHGHDISRPGKVKQNGEITFNFLEDIDAVITSAFRELEDKMWAVDSTGDSKGTREDFDQLQFTITAILLDHKDQPTQTYTIHECLLGEFDAGVELNNENDFAKPTVTVKYNYFTWKKGS